MREALKPRVVVPPKSARDGEEETAEGKTPSVSDGARARGRSAWIAGLALMLTVAFWGMTFKIVQWATDELPVLGFLTWRFLVASLALAPFAVPHLRLATCFTGGLCGVVLAAAYLFQTYGLQEIQSSESGVLTGLFILFIPPINWLLFRESTPSRMWLGILVSCLGLFLLVGGDVRTFRWGEFLTLMCAAVFGLHVSLIDRVSRYHDVLALTWVQLLTVAALCAAAGLRAGAHAWPSSTAWIWILTTGVFGSAVAFALQTYSQRHLRAIEAGILMMTEPVFAIAFGWLVGERLTPWQWFGVILMLSAVVLVGLPGKRGSQSDRPNGQSVA